MTQTPADHSTSPEPYKTSDTPFAAFLHYMAHKVVTTIQDPNDYKREVIVFLFEDDIPDLEDLWRRGEATGDLKRYHRSLKIINRQVFESRKKREKGE